MILVGITGGIGSGKSTVCRLFSLFGAKVYDSDAAAKRLMNSDKELKGQICALLGEAAYCNGALDRAYVGERVFGERQLLDGLNAIVHPRVGRDFTQWVAHYENEAYVLMESAILFESGFDKMVDKAITVSAPEALRVARTVARDTATEDAVSRRIKAQWSDQMRESKADYVIYNDDRHLVTEQVKMLDKLFRDENRSCGC